MGKNPKGRGGGNTPLVDFCVPNCISLYPALPTDCKVKVLCREFCLCYERLAGEMHDDDQDQTPNFQSNIVFKIHFILITFLEVKQTLDVIKTDFLNSGKTSPNSLALIKPLKHEIILNYVLNIVQLGLDLSLTLKQVKTNTTTTNFIEAALRFPRILDKFQFRLDSTQVVVGVELRENSEHIVFLVSFRQHWQKHLQVYPK